MPPKRLLGGETSIHALVASLPYVSKYEVIKTYPHDSSAFTQGLAFGPNGELYESDGLYGRSILREVDVATGKSVRATRMSSTYFGEGAVAHGGKLIQLVWKRDAILEYSLPELRLLREVRVRIGREGWGLATDGSRLYLTDSSTRLYHVRPGTYAIESSVEIRDAALGKPVHGLTELEYAYMYICNIYIH